MNRTVKVRSMDPYETQLSYSGRRCGMTVRGRGSHHVGEVYGDSRNMIDFGNG